MAAVDDDGAFSDLCKLPYVDMEHVCNHMEHRFRRMKTKLCYSFAGSSVLVAINPHESLPIYGSKSVDKFPYASPSSPAHPYTLAEHCISKMIQEKRSQFVVLCGVSGSGKTQTGKRILRYLAAKATDSQPLLQVAATSAILEALGNAKTIKNDNSSRFGHVVKLLYDVPDSTKSAALIGQYLDTYLLETKRVVYQQSGEGNFHIAYLMHAQLGMQQPTECYYTNQGNVQQQVHAARFNEFMEALKVMKIEDTESSQLLSLLNGIFNLGNVSFQSESQDAFISIDAQSRACMQCMERVANLWGVEGKAVSDRLLTSSIRICKRVIFRRLRLGDGVTNRDAMAQDIYRYAFLYLCERINSVLFSGHNKDDLQSNLDTQPFVVAVCDLFGFENVAVNSLQQFCINYLHEKLQQVFNYQVIHSEQQEFMAEGVFFKPLYVRNNSDFIDAVEDGERGIFRLLDSACKAPRASIDNFMADVFRECGDESFIQKTANNAVQGFKISHLVESVEYDVSNFLAKNMELIHQDTLKMLKKSNHKLISSMFQKKKRNKKCRFSTTATFARGIRKLMGSLSDSRTGICFVHCIEPNECKSATFWDKQHVEHQLLCNGLISVLQSRRMGYVARVSYATLHNKYSNDISHPMFKDMDSNSFSVALMAAFEIGEEDYCLGATKVFLTARGYAIFKIIDDAEDQPLNADQKQKIIAWLVRKRIQQIIGVCRTFLILQKRIHK